MPSAYPSREIEGKDDVIVYDYVDISVPMLERMYKRRLKTYAKLGYEIAEASDAQGPGARIVAADAWRTELAADLSRAGKRVTVSAPYANPKLVESLMPDIAAVIARGIVVQIVLRKPKGEKSLALQSSIAEMLSSVSCEVMISDTPLTGIAVFDGKVAWYGTLPLLAFAKADDCSLRVEGAEIAADLGRRWRRPCRIGQNVLVDFAVCAAHPLQNGVKFQKVGLSPATIAHSLWEGSRTNRFPSYNPQVGMAMARGTAEKN